ncbi:MAG: hypothetical protein BMS9Abin29_2218 [Gemmatimonadota bacterium]|nr:MAG: hypothetical protein BMS9Abin29_2218 [Gemmatimonadota bacterium]
MRSHRRTSWAVLVLMSLLPTLSACGGDQSAPVPGSMTLVSGDAQTAQVGTVLAQVLGVEVRDDAGAPMSGVTVSWTVAGGGGSVSAASSTTSANGQTTTTWTLGGSAGAQSVRAAAAGFTVTFTATAQAGPAAQVAVTPAQSTLDALQATVQLTAEVQDGFGNPVGGDITWASGDDAVLTVDVTGLATAVANGTATVTATSGALEGTAALTVAQAAATVAVTPEDPIIAIGGTQLLAAAVSDANGNPMAGAAVTWSSADEAIATVDAAGLVTAVAEGSATVTGTSGNASGGVTVTVILVPLPFVPAGDGDVSGTMNVAEVTIPAGVTITATSDLVINATGPVKIDGNLMGDCVAVTVNGSGAVVVTGVVDNDCASIVVEPAPSLTIAGGGAMNFNGAALRSTGDINIGNDLSALAALGPGLSRSPFANSIAQAAPQPCTFEGSGAGITQNDGLSGADGITTGIAGRRGSDVNVSCTGAVNLSGTDFSAGSGGAGGDATNPGGSATGGDGGEGGTVSVRSGSGTINVENNNTVTTGDGGKGGNAFSDGDPAVAVGGVGGNAGSFSMAPQRGMGSGALTIIRGNGGDGGTARAIGESGDDATTSQAATKGGTLSAVGGDGGIVPGPGIDPTPNAQGFTLTFTEPLGGKGGDALGAAGDGGKGSKEFPIGAQGPDITVQGGLGGTVLSLSFGTRPPGRGGDGGIGRFVGGNGGLGWNSCEDNSMFERGGDGGPGGTLTGGNGGAGFGVTLGTPSDGAPGALLVDDSGNGGDGGDGAPEKSLGGAAGTNGLAPVDGTSATITNGLEKGADGKPCDFNFNVAITVKSGGDPNGHEEFIRLTTVTMITARLTSPGVIEFTSTASVLWINTTGAVGTDGSFTTTGVGRAAGFNGTPVTFDGTVALDGEGRVTGINGMLVYDSTNSVLPAQQPPPDGDGLRHPANYNLTGTLKPPA